MTRSTFPGQQALTLGLSSVLAGPGHAGDPVNILAREPLVTGTFPKEIVTCQLDGSELRLLCKYDAGHSHGGQGHWGGVPYEAVVYAEVLQPPLVSVPGFYGAYTDRRTGAISLILEYPDRSTRVHKVSETGSMELAARWIGQF